MENYKKDKKAERIEWQLVLGCGEQNAISAEELTRRLGYKDARDTRRAVSEARLSGVPVCSLQRSERYGGGYFLPDPGKMEEVEHVANELKKRAYTSLKQVRQLNEWMQKNSGEAVLNVQMSIDDFMKQEARAEI